MHFLQSIQNTFTHIFCCKTFKDWQKNKNPYILYKIVDSYSISKKESYKIQCVNTKALFSISIQELVFDISILHGLHPVQGCFIGIEYAKVTRAMNPELQNKNKEFESIQSICRYGIFNLLYQTRKGLLGFENIRSKELFLMDPRDIALSKEFIEGFDVAQAFCIGIHAGHKFAYSTETTPFLPKGVKFKHLRLIKS